MIFLRLIFTCFVVFFVQGCSLNKQSEKGVLCNDRSLAVAFWGEFDGKIDVKKVVSMRKKMLQEVHKKSFPKDEFKVTKITHHIWFTSLQNPREISDNDLRFMQKSLMKVPLKDKWKHYLWVNEPALIPKTIAKLKPYGIIVKKINSANLAKYDSFWQKKVNELFLVSKSIPADVLTYLILEQYGGVYLDTDYELIASLDKYVNQYSFFTFEERGNQYMGHAIVGSSAHHPIMQESLTLVKRNLINPPFYICNACHDRAYVILATGPAMFSLAVYSKANSLPELRDTFFPDGLSYSRVRYGFLPVTWHQEVGMHHGSNTWVEDKQQKLNSNCFACSSDINKLNKFKFMKSSK